MKTLDEVLAGRANGLYYGCRILLPFSATILKLIIDDEIITNFSSRSGDVTVTEKQDYTEIYLHNYQKLTDAVNKYEDIKLVVVEKGNDIFDFNNHKKIALHPEEKHKLTIKELDKDILFIE